MPLPRLSWAGLLIATMGWGFLLAYPLLSPASVAASASGEIRDPARFILILGENAVVTGLAIALLGALEHGLRLLKLIASNGAMQTKAPAKPAAAPTLSGPAFSAPPPAKPALAPHAKPAMASPSLMPQRSPGDVVTRGALAGRDYILFRDGSVVVETLLGPRRFHSITEAQEFIGAN